MLSFESASLAFPFSFFSQSNYFCLGELHHGVRGSGDKKKTFTIRVYPFGHYKLRSQETCSKIIEEIYDINKLNENVYNKSQGKNNSKRNEEFKNCFGHLGMIFYYQTYRMKHPLHPHTICFSKKIVLKVFLNNIV